MRTIDTIDLDRWCDTSDKLGIVKSRLKDRPNAVWGRYACDDDTFIVVRIGRSQMKPTFKKGTFKAKRIRL